MVSKIHVLPPLKKIDVRMVSPVWYNIRRIGPAKYVLAGEHDVDKAWMKEVRGVDSNGDRVGRILPRFVVEGWDAKAYHELATVKDAEKEIIRLLLEQIKYDTFLSN
jgi:hypothetical protein